MNLFRVNKIFLPSNIDSFSTDVYVETLIFSLAILMRETGKVIFYLSYRCNPPRDISGLFATFISN